MLKELADRLQANLRSIDILGRYGGEEFVVLLPETSVSIAAEVAERLRKVVAQKEFSPAGLSLPITISLGVAGMTDGKWNLNQIIKAADDAMYSSKHNGRNRVEVAPEAQYPAFN